MKDPRLLGFVSEEKKERILRFHRFEDAQRSLLGDVLARYAICKRLGVRNKDLVLGATEYGKPILTSPSGIHFNISHSENWVVCAIDDNPVGIDVAIFSVSLILIQQCNLWFKKMKPSLN